MDNWGVIHAKIYKKAQLQIVKERSAASLLMPVNIWVDVDDVKGAYPPRNHGVVPVRSTSRADMVGSASCNSQMRDELTY